jgi:hypothetical protein
LLLQFVAFFFFCTLLTKQVKLKFVCTSVQENYNVDSGLFFSKRLPFFSLSVFQYLAAEYIKRLKEREAAATASSSAPQGNGAVARDQVEGLFLS